ncbi:MAG: AAA family ATPase [Candidatus Bathyarchaeia archaeon]|jgi:deoxycytidylate deaminase
MTEVKEKLALGLTGSFGSGCSTLGEALVKLGFEQFSLSKYVKEAWAQKNGKDSKEAKKSDLQNMGNELRESKENSYLASLAVNEANERAKENKRLVFSSIRNLGEVEYLRSSYRNFFLIAVDCSTGIRWERVKDDYKKLGQGEDQFFEDDKRDKLEEWTEHGQQVQLCVDEADMMLDNDETFPSRPTAVLKLKSKIDPYIELFEGKLRPPEAVESYMGMAYSASLMSQCIKRRVGAVIVDEKKDAILSVGYNENPYPMKPCFIKYAGCYRDICKNKRMAELESNATVCPKCEQKIKDVKFPFFCKNKLPNGHTCNFDLGKYFIKDKIMDRCTALHAEEKAILTAGSRNIEGCTLYTTTFPCFTCSQKIVFSKIKNVVYVEPYPDEDSIRLLKEADVKVNKFEGIKAKAYFRVFGPWQRKKEDEVKGT